jgi:hypothetical protein
MAGLFGDSGTSAFGRKRAKAVMQSRQRGLAAFAPIADIQYASKMPQMKRRLISLLIKIGLPVLVGQFIFQWVNSDLLAAARSLPIRALTMLVLLMAWAAFQEHRERKKRTFR